MTTTVGFPSFDPSEWAYKRNAVLGIPDSGKTYTAKGLAEIFMTAGVPIVALDPAGNWRFLRVPGKGKGFPVVVIGGAEPDIKLGRPEQAAEIMRAVIASGVSVVFDLYDPHLSKADWRKVVSATCHVLCYENKGLRHLFLEEAAEFVPQRVNSSVSVVYAEVERIVRMARNASVGVTLINQRSQEVNKAVLELCENLFLHRQTGRRSLEHVDKWLDLCGIAQQQEIVNSLPTMPQGECWAWLGDRAGVTRMKAPELSSYHPRIGGKAPPVKIAAPVNTADFVAKLKAALGQNKPEAKAAAAPSVKAAQLAVDELAVKQAREEGYRAGFAAGMDQARVIAHDLVENLASALPSEFGDQIVGKIAKLQPPGIIYKRLTTPGGASITLRGRDNGSGDLPAGERRVLTAIAQHRDGVTRPQLSILTGYKKSSRDVYVQRISARGLIAQSGDSLKITPEGLYALGDFEPLPTGNALRRHWLERLPGGESRLLGALVGYFPRAIDRATLGEATGYLKSSRDVYIQRLAARKLVVIEGRGMVRASGELFDGGTK